MPPNVVPRLPLGALLGGEASHAGKHADGEVERPSRLSGARGAPEAASAASGGGETASAESGEAACYGIGMMSSAAMAMRATAEAAELEAVALLTQLSPRRPSGASSIISGGAACGVSSRMSAAESLYGGSSAGNNGTAADSSDAAAGYDEEGDEAAGGGGCDERQLRHQVPRHSTNTTLISTPM